MEITPDILLQAYSQGVFPMAEEADSDAPLRWFKPAERAIIPLDERFHVARSLGKRLKRDDYTIRLNHDFPAVLQACRGEHPLVQPREDTWIDQEILRLYTTLHQMGYAHSLEIYDRQDSLMGGLYGVAMGGVFFGESMFSVQRDASKIALVSLVKHLRGRDFRLLDCQFMTEHLRAFGAYTIAAADFDLLLNQAMHQPTRFV